MNERLAEVLAKYSALPEYLGESPDSVASKSLFGDFPINIASTRGVLEEVIILLEAGADIDQRGEHGYTPLHNAVEQSHKAVVEHLLASGAKPKVVNDDGLTPAQLARMLNEHEILLLLQGGNP
jgi:uncharacterized protein